MSQRQDCLNEPGFLSTELANTLTHAVGLAVSVVGLIVLVAMSRHRGGAQAVAACTVYGATLVLLYLSSTLYHSSRNPRVRRVMRIVDHAAIYLLIAGTYTPFALITIGGVSGWYIFGVAWGLAALGMLYEIFFCGRFAFISILLYLCMGWLVLVVIRPVLAHLPLGGVLWLLAGGLAYTVGVVFFVWKSLPHHHAIWHLFVMGGSACHFFAVMFYVVLRIGPA
jgi:hemolysin III